MISIYYSDDILTADSEKLLSKTDRLPELRREKVKKYRNLNDQLLCISSWLLLEYAAHEVWNMKLLSETVTGKYGKPYFLNESPYFFNYSHCRCGICCALSSSEVGADIQNTEEYSIMTEVMTGNEQRCILESPVPEEKFTALWAAKESYFKMLGCGLNDRMKDTDLSFLQQGVNCTEHSTAFLMEKPGYSLAVFSRGKHEVQIKHISIDNL